MTPLSTAYVSPYQYCTETMPEIFSVK